MEKAVSLYLIGRFSEAENLLMSALDKVNRQNNPYLLPYILEGLGNIYYLQGNYTKAIYFSKKGWNPPRKGFYPATIRKIICPDLRRLG